MDYKELKRHIGHDIVCVGYSLKDKKTAWENIAIECETCNEVLTSYDKTTKITKPNKGRLKK